MATAITSSQSPPPPFDTSSPPPISTRQSLTSPSSKRASAQRPSSYAKSRLSTYSNASNPQPRSRPTSHTFPIFQSSLSYTLVRDFAYPTTHPLHYGAPPKDSGISTPISESGKLSDPLSSSRDSSRSHWPAPNWNPETMYGNQQLPAIAFGDGPPYSEDEDLHSPVVTTSRHRKNKSGLSGDSRSGSRKGMGSRSGHEISGTDHSQDGEKGTFVGVNGDGSETYYVKDEDADENGPGGEYVTYPVNEGRNSYLAPGSYNYGPRDSHFAASINTPFDREFELESDDDISDDEMWRDPSRYSRDYQFTIVSPDEEMHGKAVALFDFTREHENELPLTEGQVILVSYRHGQGWLVAEDPRTGESGLVPEEFVRLVRDIEGGLNSLNGELNTSLDSNVNATEPELTPTSIIQDNIPQSKDVSTNVMHDIDEEQGGVMVDTATKESSSQDKDSIANQCKEKDNGKDKEKGKHPPVVSTFSTSSRDLAPYPSHLLSGHQHSRSTPPQIEHYDANLGQSGAESSKRPKSISKQTMESGDGNKTDP